MSALIAESGFDWTIARISNPVSRPRTGIVRAGFLGHDPVGSVISREDVATFLVDQFTDTAYHRLGTRHQQLSAGTTSHATRNRPAAHQRRVGRNRNRGGTT